MDLTIIDCTGLHKLLDRGRVDALIRALILQLHRLYVRLVLNGVVDSRRGPMTRDDLIQEALIKLVKDDYATLRTWKGLGSLRAFVNKVGRNALFEMTRRCRAWVDEDPVGGGPPGLGADSLALTDFEGGYLQADRNRFRLNRLLKECSCQECEVLLRRIHGESVPEIAEAMGLESEHVHQTLTRIRRKCRRLNES